MPKYGLLLSGGIDSLVLQHMYPDAVRYHFSHPSDADLSGQDSVETIDISSYSNDEKHVGMQVKTTSLLADSDRGLDNIYYGYHLPYSQLDGMVGAGTEGTNDLLKPLAALNWQKHDVIRYASQNNIDLRNTISCLHERTHAGCGVCYQCLEKQIALQKLDSEGFDYSNVI